MDLSFFVSGITTFPKESEECAFNKPDGETIKRCHACFST